MNRRWLVLLALVPVAALVLGVLARRPHTAAAPVPPAIAAPEIELRLTPAVPAGRHVRLVVRNAGDDTAELRLAGYQDRVAVTAIAPGETRRLSFLADRPGDDFAWLVDARPVGRVSVTGSHLIEGHR